MIGGNLVYHVRRDADINNFQFSDELEAGEYDGIVVAAAAEEIPPALIDQLAEGGRLVIPVGTRWGQSLQVSRKRAGALHTEELCRCVFVPLVHGS